MGFDYEFAGLPLHVLLVHFTIVLVPLVALSLLVAAVVPPVGRVLWPVNLIGALGVLGLVYLTIQAGQWLQARVAATPLIAAHTSQGPNLLPWAIAIAALAVVESGVQLWFRARKRRGAPISRATSVTIAVVLGVAALTIAIGSTATLISIAEAGSRALWQGSFSETPLKH